MHASRAADSHACHGLLRMEKPRCRLLCSRWLMMSSNCLKLNLPPFERYNFKIMGVSLNHIDLDAYNYNASMPW